MRSLIRRSSRLFGSSRSRNGATNGLAQFALPAVIAIVLGTATFSFLVSAHPEASLLTFPDGSGAFTTMTKNGSFDQSNPFFQNLGTNGRTCATCHQPSDGWSVTPDHLRARFAMSGGRDPIFSPNDGSVCPSADVSTMDAREQAYKMLLTKGVIRVSIGVPDNAEFTLTDIEDPYNCPETTSAGLALFRRPLPGTNLPFLTTVMWDGRESFAGKSLEFNLADQAANATLGHAQAEQRPTDAQLASIVSFEMSTFTAQVFDSAAGTLNAQGALGGPVPLSSQQFFVGINDPLGGNPTGAAFNPVAFNLFDAWAGDDNSGSHGRPAARASVARGQALFNALPIMISGVTGLNDAPGVPKSMTGTCSTCHDAPNVGGHSVALALNIGVTDVAPPALDVSGLPVYTFECKPGVRTPIGSGTTVKTTDPGRALITGKCADIGKTKGPILRGLAARAPYFHNGSAATLADVVNFYDERFKLNLSEQQKADLVAFLKTL